MHRSASTPERRGPERWIATTSQARSECDMRDCSIQLTNNPGDLARVAQALSRRGVNIKALAGLSIGGVAVARILPDDIVVARSALEAANSPVTESEVHLVLLRDKSG